MKRVYIALIFAFAASLAFAATGYRLQARYSVPGTESFDYVTLDSTARRLYVSHSTQVEVLDADKGTAVGVIADTPGVHGIALATGMDRGFTSNGKEDKVSMFDSKTLHLTKKIAVGKEPDGIYYHPGSKRVFTNNHGSHDISAIDAETGEVVGTVKVGGDGEQAAFGANGLIYVNLENTAEVVAFDPQSLVVKKRYPIGIAKTPTGLAYDAKTNRLFIGLRNEPKMAVMDAGSGEVVTSLPIGAGVDYAGFDPDAGLIFFSCGGDGTLRIFHENSANEYEDAGTVTTQPSAKTMAFDPASKKIFLPAAAFENFPSGTSKPQRKIIAGSFAVLVVSK
jgi:YVTN family beta-propeller protein